MNLIVDSFECSGTTTLNNRTSLTVNGNAKTGTINMYNDSVISVCGSMNSTNEQNLFQSSKIIVNGVALLGTLNLRGDSKLYATGGAQFAGRINAYDNAIVNVDNAIMCNDLVWLEAMPRFMPMHRLPQRGLELRPNNIIQANGITFTQTDDNANQSAFIAVLKAGAILYLTAMFVLKETASL